MAIVLIDLYQFDSVSISATEQAIALDECGCDVSIVCNNLVGVQERYLVPREHFEPSRYDLIIYHYYVGDDLLSRVLECKGNLAVYYHGITTPPEVYAPYSPAFVEICRSGLANLGRLAECRHVWANSHYNIDQIKEYSGSDLARSVTCVFPPVLSVDRFLRANARHDLSAVRLIYVGRLFASKNVEGMIALYHDLVQRCGSDVFLTIVGSKAEPNYLEHLKRQYSAASAEKIEVYIGRNDETLRTLYGKANVFGTFSHHEGFCIPVIEAMARGLLVVTHRMTALPETVGNVGIVVDPYDYSEAARRVGELFSDLGQFRSETVRQKVFFENEYSSTHMTRKFLAAVIEATK